MSAEGMKARFGEAKKALLNAQRICIISHRSPDGDTIGSNLALRYVLESLGKTVVSACVDPIPKDSIWLRHADKFVNDFDYNEFDLIVSVDCGAKKLIVFHEKKPELFSGEKPYINIDHHESNDGFGTINLVDSDAAATAFIVYFFIKYSGWAFTADVATALMHGLYFDTGSFMHSNTSEYVLKVASDLMAHGANIQRVAKELFHTTPINKMRLWGRILERTYVNPDGVTVSAVNRQDYDSCEASSRDTGGIIDLLNAVPGSKYAVLLSEDERGLVRGSLRTQRDDVNLSDVAKQFGGGGHPKASGFGIQGRLEPQISWRIVDGAGGASASGADGSGAHDREIKF